MERTVQSVLIVTMEAVMMGRLEMEDVSVMRAGVLLNNARSVLKDIGDCHVRHVLHVIITENVMMGSMEQETVSVIPTLISGLTVKIASLDTMERNVQISVLRAMIMCVVIMVSVMMVPWGMDIVSVMKDLLGSNAIRFIQRIVAIPIV